MPVGTPTSRYGRPSVPVNDLRARRHADLGGGPGLCDGSPVDDDRLIFGEMVSGEKGANVGEGNRGGRGLEQSFDDRRRTLGERLILDLLKLGLLRFEPAAYPRQCADGAEKLA